MVIFFFAVSAHATDPCQFVGKQGSFNENDGGCYISNGDFVHSMLGKASSQYFLVRQIESLQAINKHTQEMKQNVTALKKSIDVLNETSLSLTSEKKN